MTNSIAQARLRPQAHLAALKYQNAQAQHQGRMYFSKWLRERHSIRTGLVRRAPDSILHPLPQHA